MEAMNLGRVQLQIMQVLWDKQQATAREITDAINALEPIAHSTVQTMLRVLEEKQAVQHKAEGRTFVFYPLVPETDFKQSATQNLVERVFGGSVSNLLAHLLDCRKVTKQEIDEIRKMINRQAKR
jgi:predicted transcriptional regulator